MADAKTEKQKVQEITEKLEQGIKELFESEKYKTYLNTMSKFHNYSFNNTMLIAMQKPDATLVAGFKAWQKNFDRHVKKGEKGIRILAPAPYKIKEEQEKLDPVTGEIMLDKNGMPVTEEVEIKIPAFRVVPVFDVSQTDGKELPDIGVNELSGSVEDYEDFMQALTEVSPVPISYEDIDGDAKGYFHTTDHRIAIQEGMSQSQTVKTAIHEVAHAKLHDREQNQDIDTVLDKDRNTKEVEAESVAYTVCQHFGIDTSDYSFGYIAGWSSDRDMKELKSSLDTIRKTASELITGIEDRLAELQKDRVVEQEQNKESILLIQNDDLTQYSLVSVVGMDRQELMDVLSAMSEDDKLSIQAYLESKGAWTTEIANEDTKEFGEYHLDVRYNTDTEELVDMKERKEIYDKSMEPIAAGDVVVKFSGSMGSEWEISKITNMSPDEVKKLLYDMALFNENEWDGDYNAYLKAHGAEMTLISSSAGLNEHAPQFFDFAYDADTGVSASTELSAIQQAENLINRMEHGARLRCNEGFSDEQKAGFIARQLVETSQGTKGIADLLKQMLPDTELVYVKANNVSRFRQNKGKRHKKGDITPVEGFPKSRVINDFHHAQDAYLNIVVGNVYHTKFTSNPLNFIKNDFHQDKENYEYNLGRMFEQKVSRNGYIAWIPEGNKEGLEPTINTVNKVMGRNTPMLTRRAFVKKGIVNKVTVYGKNVTKKNPDAYLPLKTSDSRLSDVSKYGGYTSISICYFFLVEHEIKGKKVRTIESLPGYMYERVEDNPLELERFCEDKLGLINFSVRYRKIRIQSLFKINGFYAHLSSKTGDSLAMRNSESIYLPTEYQSYISYFERHKDEKESDLFSSKLNCEIYDYLYIKICDGVFKKKKRADIIRDTMSAGRDTFLQLNESGYQSRNSSLRALLIQKEIKRR